MFGQFLFFSGLRSFFLIFWDARFFTVHKCVVLHPSVHNCIHKYFYYDIWNGAESDLCLVLILSLLNILRYIYILLHILVCIYLQIKSSSKKPLIWKIFWKNTPLKLLKIPLNPPSPTCSPVSFNVMNSSPQIKNFTILDCRKNKNYSYADFWNRFWCNLCQVQKMYKCKFRAYKQSDVI